MTKTKSLIHRSQLSRVQLGLFVAVFALIGGITLLVSHAAGNNAALEAENGSLSNNATVVSDSTASGGKFVQFGSAPSGGGGTADYKITGTTYYVSSGGSDSNSGTSQSSPWKSIPKANSAALKPGDGVLFAGGQTFGGTELSPAASGTSSSPVIYGSYGSGRAKFTGSNAAVYITSGRHDIVFQELDLSSSNDTIFASQGSGSNGVSNITLLNSSLHDTPYAAVHNMPVDSNWTIRGSTIKHTGDTGLLIQGPGTVIDKNTISNTGTNSSLTYGKHGIYAKASNLTISDNDFSADTGGSLISIRYGGAKVYGNTIHDSSVGVSFFPQDPSNSGTDYVYYNKMWNISDWIFYYAGMNDSGIDGNPNAVQTAMNVVYANNTALMPSGSGVSAPLVNLSELQVASVWVANNIFTGTYKLGYYGCPHCSEFNNVWYGGSSSIPSGANDIKSNPLVNAAPGLSLQSGSPAINKGTASIPGLTYSVSSDGAPLHYNGAAPDMGAVESP